MELDPSYNLKSQLDTRVVMTLLLKLTNIRLSTVAKSDLMKSPENFQFVECDIRSIEARSRPFHFLYLADAQILYAEVLGQRGRPSLHLPKTDENLRLLEIAFVQFKNAHDLNPACPNMIAHCGHVMTQLAMIKEDVSEKEKLLHKAEWCYEKAIQYYNTYREPYIGYNICAEYHCSLIPHDKERVKKYQQKMAEYTEKMKDTSEFFNM